MSYGKVVELYLVNGDADGIVVAELSNWDGKAIKIPRSEINTYDKNSFDDDLSQPGVYFLFVKEDDGSDSVYIGESDNIEQRLKQHVQAYQKENEKYYWNTAVVFIGRDLNKSFDLYLEKRFTEIARQNKRYNVFTEKTSQCKTYKKSQQAVMEEYISNAKILITALGYKVLDPLIAVNKQSVKEELLYLKIGNANAVGKATSDGFVVLRGAKINEKIAEKSLLQSMVERRKFCNKNGDIKDCKTQTDLLFSSPSTAAAFVVGYSISGPLSWKNKQGISYNEIEKNGDDRTT